MEHTLRCNSLKCRKELNDHAVVTTCSHVFCIDCSNRCQLSGQREGLRPVCPACDMHLVNPDDVVVTTLNPTEDYKTSVLSGLSPNVIMECAGRALSFWAYQTTQEIVYQEYLAKNLTDKYASLNTQMDKIIHDANSEISNLRNKMSNMTVDQDNLRRKNEELVQAFREKSRKQLQTQELYDKLKRRAMLGQVQNAASDAVDHTIQASVTANRLVNRHGNQNQPTSQDAVFPQQRATGAHFPSVVPEVEMGPPIGRVGNGDAAWSVFNSQENSHHNQPVQTPSTHRQRLAGNASTPRIGIANLQSNGATVTPMPQRSPASRPALASLNGNNGSNCGFAGYGMSAGLKVSNPSGPVSSGFSKPVTKSRIAQRPASGLPNDRQAAFGPNSTGNLFSNGGIYY